MSTPPRHEHFEQAESVAAVPMLTVPLTDFESAKDLFKFDRSTTVSFLDTAAGMPPQLIRFAADRMTTNQAEPTSDKQQKGTEAKDAKPSLRDDASAEEIAEYLKKNSQPVSYSDMWPKDTPVMFIGEYHTSLAMKDEVIQHLSELKKQGLTHVGMEMFRQEDQELLDKYFAGKVTREEVVKNLERGWDKGPGTVDKYMEMVDAIKDAGLKILCLDLYTAGPEYGTAEFFKKRNENWARIIDETLSKDPNARVMVYCGQAHSGYNQVDDSANEILDKRYGRKSVVVELAGGEPPEHDFFFADHVGVAAQKTGKDQERFAIRLDKADDVRGADYTIHLPQRKLKK